MHIKWIAIYSCSKTGYKQEIQRPNHKDQMSDQVLSESMADFL
jgi:hypothetical protein